MSWYWVTAQDGQGYLVFGEFEGRDHVLAYVPRWVTSHDARQVHLRTAAIVSWREALDQEVVAGVGEPRGSDGVALG